MGLGVCEAMGGVHLGDGVHVHLDGDVHAYRVCAWWRERTNQ